MLALAAANQAPAGTRAYTTTANPTFAKTYSTMQTLGANGTVKNNQSANDYNTLTTSYQPTGNDQRNFYTARLDYNVTSKHTLSFVYNYDKYVSIPNFLNGSADLPRLGYGALSTVNTGQRAGTAYSPRSDVVALSFAPVAVLRTLTDTPGTARRLDRSPDRSRKLRLPEQM